ncbi:MAG: hypothetical protein L0206_00945 [Actinobacteria bacterium]|nr:hypothetical protein [Actinomycetota bacterium]
MTWTAEVGRVVSDVEETIDDGVDATRAFLASPAGRRFRGYVATGLIVAAPLILRHPFFRTPLGRTVQLAGVVAAIPKIAELIRDWNPAASGPGPNGAAPTTR